MLCKLPTIGNTLDGREVPPRTLNLRRRIDVPKGATFFLDEDLLNEYIDTGAVSDRDSESIVGELTMHGTKEVFSFYEFKTLTSTIPDSERKKHAEKPVDFSLNLLLELYIRRHPYKDS